MKRREKREQLNTQIAETRKRLASLKDGGADQTKVRAQRDRLKSLREQRIALAEAAKEARGGEKKKKSGSKAEAGSASGKS